MIHEKTYAQSQLMDFVGVGGHKCGSTYLYSLMRQHEKINFPRVNDKNANIGKELHYFWQHRFFNSNNTPINIKKDLNRRCFNWKHGCLHGEITPSYMTDRQTMARIRTYNPNVKIIAILRSPIDRALSHWNWLYSLSGNSTYLADKTCKRSLSFVYAPGFYPYQIQIIKDFFDEQNIYFEKFDNLVKYPQEVMNTIFGFLGVEGVVRMETENVFKRTTGCIDPNIPIEKERIDLKNLYYYSIKDVERMLGWDCSDWLKI